MKRVRMGRLNTNKGERHTPGGAMPRCSEAGATGGRPRAKRGLGLGTIFVDDGDLSYYSTQYTARRARWLYGGSTRCDCATQKGELNGREKKTESGREHRQQGEEGQ